MDAIHVARSIPDALAALTRMGPSARVMAGATWVMRGPLRGEAAAPSVAIGGIPELAVLGLAADSVTIGACVTHAALAQGLAGLPELNALAQAAAHSANPAVRNVATVGGNLCAIDFAAADLVPALLCLDATVECSTTEGAQRLSLGAFLAQRRTMPATTMLTRVHVPRRGRRSAHVRLPLRKAGDYPVAIVSMAVDLHADDVIESADVAVGSVEATARRWTGLERAMAGMPLDPAAIAKRAAGLTGDFTGRDGIEAPGWYRIQVLPTLVRRALESLRISH